MDAKTTTGPADFDRLQRRLVHLWEHIYNSDPGRPELEAENTTVVLPSLTASVRLDSFNQQAYEERMLFMLFLLQQPYKRIIYLSSMPVPPAVIDYYLHVMPSVTVSSARKRLFLISPQDASSQPLTQKLLDRPRLLEHIRSLIPDPSHAHLVPFLTTGLERELALRLDIPMYAADPRFFAFGTKSGCRRLFAEEGLAHPLGAEDLHTAEDLVGAIAVLRRRKPELHHVIVKHNQGVSGFGNATLDLDGLPAPGDPDERAAIAARLPELRFQLPEMTLDEYLQRLEKEGGVLEEMLAGEALFSPSAQLRVTPLGEVELLSTHDQMLGGPGGQIYLGAKFPAGPAYGPLIMAEAEKVGRRLAREGIVGRFALDFIVLQDAGRRWQPYAIEINLRKGGTTHPFLTLQFLTGGAYDAGRGVFCTARGHEKYYVASDNLKSPAYRVFTPEDLFDLVSEHRLHFDHTSQTGVVMHMLSGVAASGRLGVTAIGNSPAEAEELYGRFVDTLDAESAASQAGEKKALPH